MLGRAAVVAIVLVASAACDSGGGAGPKQLRQHANVSVAGGIVWVAGGAIGTQADLQLGTPLDLPDAVVGYDADGDEVASVPLDLGGNETLTEAAVVEVGDARLVAAGVCPTFGGFGCNGPVRPFVAWLTDDGADRVDLGGDHEGVARLVGAADGVAWLVVDQFEPKLARLADGDGAVTLSDLPPFVFTGDTCVGPDGLAAAVADNDEQFRHVGVDLFRRGTEPDDDWQHVGRLDFDPPNAGGNGLGLECLGDGLAFLDTRDGARAPVVVDLDDGRVVDEAPEELRGVLLTTVDPATGTLVAAPRPDGRPAPVWARTAGGDWSAIGSVAGSANVASVLAVVDGEVLDVGGAAAVVGATPARLGALP